MLLLSMMIIKQFVKTKYSECKHNSNYYTRFDEKGRSRGPGRIVNQWTKCQGREPSTSASNGKPCNVSAHISCLCEKGELENTVKTKVQIEQLVYYCKDHK